jgi:hypothetical protein
VTIVTPAGTVQVVAPGVVKFTVAAEADRLSANRANKTLMKKPVCWGFDCVEMDVTYSENQPKEVAAY